MVLWIFRQVKIYYNEWYKEIIDIYNHHNDIDCCILQFDKNGISYEMKKPKTVIKKIVDHFNYDKNYDTEWFT